MRKSVSQFVVWARRNTTKEGRRLRRLQAILMRRVLLNTLCVRLLGCRILNYDLQSVASKAGPARSLATNSVRSCLSIMALHECCRHCPNI